MTVRHYSSLDTGAPVLPSVSGQRWIDNLKLILKACLVDGYGTKPAAGWTVGHEHADGFSLSNGEGFINFVSVSSTAVAVYLMETITDGSTALAGGYNRRSGPWSDGAADAGRQYVYAFYMSSTYANKQWCVVADNRTATLAWQANSTAVDVTANSIYAGVLHFGAYLPAMGGSGFCAIGGNVSASAYPATNNTSQTSAVGTVLRHPMTGVVAQGASPNYRAGVATDGATTPQSKSVLAPGALRPVRVSLMGRGAGVSGSTSAFNDTHCGVLRGLLADPGVADAYASKMFPALGISNPTSSDKLRAMTIPGGRQWVPFYPHDMDLGMFASLDAADWS
jgi:hypothetical protein